MVTQKCVQLLTSGPVNVTFRERAFADIIQDPKVRSSWVKVGNKFNGSLLRREDKMKRSRLCEDNRHRE